MSLLLLNQTSDSSKPQRHKILMVFQIRFSGVQQGEGYIPIPMGSMALHPFTAPYDKQTPSLEFSSYEDAAMHIVKLQRTKSLKLVYYFIYSHSDR